MEKIINNWKLAIVKNSDGTNATHSSEIKGEVINASVPGNFELDMYESGMIPDPYYGDNVLALQDFEDRHLYYFTTLDFEQKDGFDAFIEFGGIDTVADIYIDGSFLGHTENMLIPHTFPLGLADGKHELLVHIRPSVIEAQKVSVPSSSYFFRYNGDSVALRKAPYMYGWDIMPRIVSGGLWKDVKIIYKPKSRIEDFYLFTQAVDNGTAVLMLNFSMSGNQGLIKDYSYKIDGICGGSRFTVERRLFSSHTHERIVIESPKLWYPKNYGEQNLYSITLTLYKNGVECDRREFEFGIRVIELVRTAFAGDDGEFCFYVNGQKVFVLGTNWVPLDAFPSRHASLQSRALEMLDEIGCNTVRCWGGNVYPDEDFYKFCDRHGIMVWQDFSLACAHYTYTEKFAREIEAEALAVVKQFRLHPSLAIWSGDNECDGMASYCRPEINGHSIPTVIPEHNIHTRQIIPRVIRDNDCGRQYLPSSPYWENTIGVLSGKKLSESHLWGPRDFFKGEYYSTAVAHFASETGYHGCPSPETLKEFIPEESLTNWGDGKVCLDKYWLTHAACMEVPDSLYAYRIPLMTRQVERLFGKIPKDIETYSLMSQISQAEAKKYFIERFRVGKWRRTGIIWWNLIDGWPQISDAVVDWYGRKKLAYSYINRSQQPFCMMFDEGITLVAVNDTQKDISVDYKVWDATNGTTVISGSCNVSANANLRLESLPDEKGHFYVIEWSGDEKGKNHFVTSIGDGLELNTYTKCLEILEEI